MIFLYLFDSKCDLEEFERKCGARRPVLADSTPRGPS